MCPFASGLFRRFRATARGQNAPCVSNPRGTLRRFAHCPRPRSLGCARPATSRRPATAWHERPACAGTAQPGIPRAARGSGLTLRGDRNCAPRDGKRSAQSGEQTRDARRTAENALHHGQKEDRRAFRGGRMTDEVSARLSVRQHALSRCRTAGSHRELIRLLSSLRTVGRSEYKISRDETRFAGTKGLQYSPTCQQKFRGRASVVSSKQKGLGPFPRSRVPIPKADPKKQAARVARQASPKSRPPPHGRAAGVEA